MDDVEALGDRNLRFIEACRQGSWEMLQPILSPSFAYLDGATGEVWEMDRYIKDLRENPAPTLVIDQLAIHVDGDTAVASARTQSRPGQSNRYIDTYERRGGEWLCARVRVAAAGELTVATRVYGWLTTEISPRWLCGGCGGSPRATVAR